MYSRVSSRFEFEHLCESRRYPRHLFLLVHVGPLRHIGLEIDEISADESDDCVEIIIALIAIDIQSIRQQLHEIRAALGTPPRVVARRSGIGHEYVRFGRNCDCPEEEVSLVRPSRDASNCDGTVHRVCRNLFSRISRRSSTGLQRMHTT